MQLCLFVGLGSRISQIINWLLVHLHTKTETILILGILSEINQKWSAAKGTLYIAMKWVIITSAEVTFLAWNYVPFSL